MPVTATASDSQQMKMKGLLRITSRSRYHRQQAAIRRVNLSEKGDLR